MRSPRLVLRAAYRLGQRVLRDYPCNTARHDFTLPQLFACLVLREFYGLSYRRTEPDSGGNAPGLPKVRSAFRSTLGRPALRSDRRGGRGARDVQTQQPGPATRVRRGTIGGGGAAAGGATRRIAEGAPK